MEHPLIPNLDHLSQEELLAKITELNRKLGIAYNLGNHALCGQIRLAIASYQTKYDQLIRRQQDGNDFGSLIDVK